MNNQSTLNLTGTEQPHPILPHALNNLWRHVQKQVSTPRLIFFSFSVQAWVYLPLIKEVN